MATLAWGIALFQSHYEGKLDIIGLDHYNVKIGSSFELLGKGTKPKSMIKGVDVWIRNAL